MIKSIVETINSSLNTAHTFVFVTDKGEANLSFDNTTFPATVLYLDRSLELITKNNGLVQYRYSRLEVAFMEEIDIDSTADQIYTKQLLEIAAANQFMNLMKDRIEWQRIAGNTELTAAIQPLAEGFDDSVTGVTLIFNNLVLQGANVCS